MLKTISKIGLKGLEKLYYGRDDLTKFDSRNLLLLSKASERCLIKTNSSCDTPKVDLKSKLVESVKRLSIKYGVRSYEPINKAVLIKDDSDNFIRNNPGKVSLKDWQKISRGICAYHGITFSAETSTKCDNLALEIQLETIPCEVLSAISVIEYIRGCETGYTVTRTDSKCKLDWGLMMEIENCDISFKDYSTIVDLGYTFDVIKEIYSNGLALEIKDGKINLRGKIDTFEIEEDICFDSVNMTGISDRKLFLDKVLADLNISQEIKKELYTNI